MQLTFKTLDDVDYIGKRILIRVDINCSVDPETKKITDSSRIDAIRTTLEELSQCKVVLMAHQGSPGSDDFISLEQHTEILKNYGFNAKFVDDIFGSKAKEAISQVKIGEILVLQNVRYFDGELKKAPPEEVEAVKTLARKKMSEAMQLSVIRSVLVLCFLLIHQMR